MCYNIDMDKAEQTGGLMIREQVSIADLTTMRLGGKAKYVIELNERGDIENAIDFARTQGLPIWVMGGGANTIGRDEGFPGAILLNRLKGIFIEKDGVRVPLPEVNKEELGDELILTGMGGEKWDDFVAAACDLGYSGIEAMSMIPGTLGAAPVQNIGAYGQDMSQTIESVEAYDLRERRFVVLRRDEMNMGYRTTRFNHGADTGRFLIISVTMRLKKGNMAPPFYRSLKRYIDEHGETDFSPNNIRKMVMVLRAEKLPDPEIEASAGSFFKNVLIKPEEIADAEDRGIPVWRNADGTGKINTGWLIERAGLSGQEFDGFKVSDQASLILINQNAKSYTDLARARQKIRQAVEDKFGYQIEQEPVELIAKEGE